MDDGLKQRLIGAFVLFALAVIFVPVFFDRERIEPLDKTSQIPPAPTAELIEIEAPVRHAEARPDASAPADSAPPPDSMYIPDETAPEPLTAEAPGFDAQGAPNAWVLQIAAFRFEKHAAEYRDTLIKDGFSAYIRTVKTPKGEMTRVFVGPKLDKNVLLRQKEVLQKKYKVDPIVVKFEP